MRRKLCIALCMLFVLSGCGEPTEPAPINKKDKESKTSIEQTVEESTSQIEDTIEIVESEPTEPEDVYSDYELDYQRDFYEYIDIPFDQIRTQFIEDAYDTTLKEMIFIRKHQSNLYIKDRYILLILTELNDKESAYLCYTWYDPEEEAWLGNKVKEIDTQLITGSNGNITLTNYKDVRYAIQTGAEDEYYKALYEHSYMYREAYGSYEHKEEYMLINLDDYVSQGYSLHGMPTE